MKNTITSLEFDEKNLKYAFNLSSPDTMIKIKRIIIDSLYGQHHDIWGEKLMRLNPQLEFIWISFNRRIYNETHEIAMHNSPYHRHPIFDMDIISPNMEDKRKTDFHRCELELKYALQDDVKPIITVEYETNNGVHLQTRNIVEAVNI